MTDNLSRNLMLSGVGHAFVFVLLFVRAFLLPSEPINIRNAIRVDVVALPKKMDALPEPVATPPPPAPAPAPTPPAPKVVAAPPPPPPAPKAPSVDVRKKPDLAKAEKAALNRIKTLEALEKIDKEVSAEKAPPKPRINAVAGNTVAMGNALSGLDKIDYDHYFETVSAKIHSVWSIPEWLADGNFSAQVVVMLDEKGYVIKKVFRKSSGNDIFDSKVMETIDASSPLPPPPERLRATLANRGLVLGFPQ